MIINFPQSFNLWFLHLEESCHTKFLWKVDKIIYTHVKFYICLCIYNIWVCSPNKDPGNDKWQLFIWWIFTSIYRVSNKGALGIPNTRVQNLSPKGVKSSKGMALPEALAKSSVLLGREACFAKCASGAGVPNMWVMIQYGGGRGIEQPAYQILHCNS